MIGFDLFCLFENIIISVFNGLNSMFHFKAQFFNVSRSVLIVCSESWQFLNVPRRDTSSAKSDMFERMLISISFRKIRNNRGARIDPCGTDPKISKNSDACPARTTLCVRPVRYDRIQLNKLPWTPIWRSFKSNRLWQTLSNALLRSRNTIAISASGTA